MIRCVCFHYKTILECIRLIEQIADIWEKMEGYVFLKRRVVEDILE